MSMNERRKEVLDVIMPLLPIKMPACALFSIFEKCNISRYQVIKELLKVSPTTGRTIALNSDYVIEIENPNDVNIFKVIRSK